MANRGTQSKNPVFLFCLSNSERTLLDVSYFPPLPLPPIISLSTNTLQRMIVKPSCRDPPTTYYDDINDAFGIDTDPREICINKIVNKMDEDARDLFTNCIHYSYGYLGGVEMCYLYLAYEDGGSLGSLQYSHMNKTYIEQKDRKANPGLERPDSQIHLPEIFVWCVFERLVRACYALRKEKVALFKQSGFVHHGKLR